MKEKVIARSVTVVLLIGLVLSTAMAQQPFSVHGKPGTSYHQIGNMTYGSDGTSYHQIGNMTYGSDGTSYHQIGNMTYGSDGTSCNKIGNTTFCN